VAVSTRSVGQALGVIVGVERVSDGPDALAAVAVDGVLPRWVVRPATVNHIAGTVALAHEEGLHVVPRGSGSSLALGHPAAGVDIVLDLSAMNDLVEYSPDDLTVTVQTGVTLGALNDGALRPRGQWLPIDGSGASGRTIGGLVATNASGPLRQRYGTLRDLLLGVRFVQADGVVTWGGARVVKSVTGYDVPKLMVGALGTLGVLAELTLRLHPRPDADRTWLALLPSVEAAQDYVARVVDSTIQPMALELFDEAALRAVPAETAPAAVAVRVGSVAEAVREQGDTIMALAAVAGGMAVPASADFWQAAAAALEPGVDEVVLRIATLASDLAGTVRAVAAGAETLGSTGAMLVTGSAALGILRVLVTGATAEGVASLVERVRGHVAAHDGSVVVQAGPRELRASLDPWGPVDPGAFALMKAIREEFDPRRVLNPGRFVGGL
jgi:glycolate oxidase FAD binding subunit